jgi:hypothetical protein
MPREHGIGKGESLQVHARTIAFLLLAVLALLTATGFGLTLFFQDRVGQDHVVARRFPSPQLVPDERTRRLRLEARQRSDLAGAHGRMPIEQAMQAIVARDDHAFDPVAP